MFCDTLRSPPWRFNLICKFSLSFGTWLKTYDSFSITVFRLLSSRKVRYYYHITLFSYSFHILKVLCSFFSRQLLGHQFSSQITLRHGIWTILQPVTSVRRAQVKDPTDLNEVTVMERHRVKGVNVFSLSLQKVPIS